MVSWSPATPLFANPDRPAQVAEAVAVAHGEFTGIAVRNGSYYALATGVHIPAYYQQAFIKTGYCIAQPDRTPACGPAFDAFGQPRQAGADVSWPLSAWCCS
jgi:hypothetical protein